MAPEYIDYKVLPNPNVPAGLAATRLTVLSPVWEGENLTLQFPQGDTWLLVGWATAAGGSPVGLRAFWTQVDDGPPVCLVLGGDAGLKMLPVISDTGEAAPDPAAGRGYPFLALAASVIPAEVAARLGPPPGTAAVAPALLLK